MNSNSNSEDMVIDNNVDNSNTTNDNNNNNGINDNYNIRKIVSDNNNNNNSRLDVRKTIMEEEVPTKRIKLCTLNPHIVCLLCAGYLVDATTIVECLHTFCKSCIVRYLQSSKLCPTCGNLIHETDPVSRIKRDNVMQEIMDKILPSIKLKEKQAEEEFVAGVRKKEADLERRMNSALKPGVDAQQLANSFQCGEKFNLCLRLSECSEMMLDGMEVEEVHQKYMRCSARAKISHLKRVIRKSYEPYCDDYDLKVQCNGLDLGDNEHMKLVFIQHWKRRCQPILFSYSFHVPPEDAEMIDGQCTTGVGSEDGRHENIESSSCLLPSTSSCGSVAETSIAFKEIHKEGDENVQTNPMKCQNTCKDATGMTLTSEHRSSDSIGKESSCSDGLAMSTESTPSLREDLSLYTSSVAEVGECSPSKMTVNMLERSFTNRVANKSFAHGGLTVT